MKGELDSFKTDILAAMKSDILSAVKEEMNNFKEELLNGQQSIRNVPAKYSYNTGANNTEMEYYYYIRYDNLVLAEDGSLTTDFTRIRHPEKSSTPIELLLGEGDDVALPGLLNFRTLAGFRRNEPLHMAFIRNWLQIPSSMSIT